MTAPPRVSVVVPTRNRAASLPALLTALDAQDYPSFDVIVVDDASTDETQAVLASWQREGHIALRQEEPRGSYAARNAGWRSATGEIVAFTDDDCLPAPAWISALVSAMSGGAEGAQGMTLAEPGERTPFTHQIEARHPGPPYRTCNIAYRRTTLEALGGFDESFRWYGDNILGLEVRKRGEIVWAPGAVVRHPPRPRQWRSRTDWLARFEADARHHAELRRLAAETVSAPPGALPVLLWVLRPLAKQSLFHLRYAVAHPRAYLGGLGPMLREKRELVVAMREHYRGESPTAALSPLPPDPMVAVIVVTRDRPGHLRNVLQALGHQTWPHRMVVVVNNGTGDVDVPPGTRVVEAGGLRLSEVRQRGLDAAHAPVVAFTDDDCLPAPDWLERLVAALHADAALRGVQGRTVAEEGPVGSHAVEVSEPNRLYQTCNIAYRREALERVGGFDSAFDGWFEDTALAARVLEDGPIGFAGDALVTHVAVPRRPLDREAWRRVIADERRLAERYPRFYHRTRAPAPVLGIVARWLLGSPVKTALRQRPRRPGEIWPYLRLLGALLRERWDLVRVLATRA